MSDSIEPGTTGVAVPPQTRAQAREEAAAAESLPDTGRRGQWHSLTVPGFWGASSSRACRSRRRCSPAPG